MGNTLGYPRMTKSRSSNKENEIAIALVYHPRILLAVTVHSVRKKSGSTRLHDVGRSTLLLACSRDSPYRTNRCEHFFLLFAFFRVGKHVER